MTKNNNVIKFPTTDKEKEQILGKNIEFVNADDEPENIQKESLVFAYEVIDELHDMLHSETGDCIFTDNEYMPLVIFAAEVISAIYLLSHGIDEHPMMDIANDLFGDIDIDNSEDFVYTDDENDDEEKE
jgi:hypothetical protein